MTRQLEGRFHGKMIGGLLGGRNSTRRLSARSIAIYAEELPRIH
jgi:hypothetical protein